MCVTSGSYIVMSVVPGAPSPNTSLLDSSVGNVAVFTLGTVVFSFHPDDACSLLF